MTHYFSNERKIFSDKISKFVFKCNEKSKNVVIQRLEQIYTHIFIDEAQDLSGWDLSILELISKSSICMILVGDPRQKTYETHHSSKNKQHCTDGPTLFNYFRLLKNIEDLETLKENRRCRPEICTLSNALYPQLPEAKSANKQTTGHDGIFRVKKVDVEAYLKKHAPMQLRYNKEVSVSESYPAINFGAAKGLTYEHVIIYPTDPIKKWLKDNNFNLAEKSRAELYVAITRARQSVAFVFDYKENEIIEGIQNYIN